MVSLMDKIITVTLNPAIDRITEVADFHVGDVLTAKEAHVYPAGKGVNVARALSCMNHDVVAIGLIGKSNVDFFDTIRKVEGDVPHGTITPDWILTEHPTRTNNTFLDPVRGTETHVREICETTEVFPMEEVKQALQRHCGKGDVVVFAGSLPTNAPVDTLAELCLLCKQLGAKVIIDSNGEALKQSLKASPDLIKPNGNELQELVGHRFYTKSEIVSAAQSLSTAYQIPYVLVSLGEEGAIIVSSEDHLSHEAMFMLKLSQTQLHAVGCGDAMVAAVSIVLLEGGDASRMLVDGTAAGVANLMTEGPGMVSADKMKRLREAVEVSRIF